MKRPVLTILFACAAFWFLMAGCKNPCESKLGEVRDQVLQFINDTDPLTDGAQACVTDVGSPSYDEICDFARRAVTSDWPYFGCSSCDAVELSICSCYHVNSWVVDVDSKPKYPGMVYCLANYYRMRDMCACAAPETCPCPEPNTLTLAADKAVTYECRDPAGEVQCIQFCPCIEPDQYLDAVGTCRNVLDDAPVCDPYVCYEYGSIERVCATDRRSMIKSPSLTQTNTCDAIMEAFECVNYDGDADGIPDAYDGGQDKGCQYSFEPPECLDGPPGTAAWSKFSHQPVSMYDSDPSGKIWINNEGCNYTVQDRDVVGSNPTGDGVSDSCDNCPDAPNGFNCRREINGQLVFASRCDFNLDGVTTEDEYAVGDQKDTDDDFVGDGCDNCPTMENIGQADRDSDGFGDPCDNCPTINNRPPICTTNTECANTWDANLQVVGTCRLSIGRCSAQLDADHDGKGDACP